MPVFSESPNARASDFGKFSPVPPRRDVSRILIVEDEKVGMMASEQLNMLIPANDPDRLVAVRRYSILDTPPDGAFDRITAIAARLFDVPISIISIVDHDRIWFKSRHGLNITEIGRDPGLCASAILSDDVRILTDAKLDPHALANPLVAGDFGLRFYVGVPLRTSDGFNLGTLCVIDKEPREVTPEMIAHLRDLASVVMDQLELRRAAVAALDTIDSSIEEIAAAARRLRFMAESMPQKIFTAKANGEVDYFNGQWMEFTGLSFEQIRDWGWTQFIHPDDVAENVRRWRHSIESGEFFEFVHRFRRADGAYRWHLSRAHVMRGEDGNILMWIGSNTEIHEQQEMADTLRSHEERQNVLVKELNHRVKNLFAVASSVVALSAHSASTPKDMEEAVQGRLHALARAHDLVMPTLVGAADTTRVTPTLDSLVRTICSPYLDPGRSDRFTFEGSAVQVGQNAATSFALFFHELATNSAKYGALSSPSGRVEVVWTVSHGTLRLSWEERGGPALEVPPSREGFGSQLVRQSIEGQLDGTLSRDWKREGLAVHLSVLTEHLLS